MESFATAWPKLLDRIARSEAFAIGTDFDGTVVPLMDRPEAVTLSERASATLHRLATRPRTSLAIVSGRSLADLSARAPIRDAVLIGNHGLEVRVPGRPATKTYDESDLGVTQSLLARLRQQLPDIAGLQFEDKGPVLAVHYRRVSRGDVPLVVETVRSLAAELSPLIQVIEGSDVFEFCPGRPFGKGSALLKAWADFGVPARATYLYFGNDVTDEDVFVALPPDAITVHVGTPSYRGAARYLTETPTSVLDALDKLDKVIASRESSDEPDDTPKSAGRIPMP